MTLDLKHTELDSSEVTENLVIVQSAFLQPDFVGNGKWAIVSAQTRRSVVAVQPDRSVPPPILSLLSKARAGRADEHDMARLRSVNLGVRPDQWETPETFTSFYHRYVTNYPFLDYSEPGWLLKDRELMRTYESAERHPARSSERTYSSGSLPADATSVALMKITRAVVRSRGDIPGVPLGPWHKKGIPSGGARHPTEVWLLWEESGICAQATYDVASGTWVRSWYADLPAPPRPTLLITSKVGRAMWRYREARSWRPVLIDAGHVVSALTTRAASSGMVLFTVPVPAQEGMLDDSREPAIMALQVQSEDATAASAEWLGHTANHDTLPSESLEGGLITSPFAWMTFGNDCLIASSTQLHRSSPNKHVKLDDTDLAILTHCTFSRRGDRDTRMAGLLGRFGTDAARRVELLVRAGILVSKKDAHSEILRAADWFSKGWYLSLLAHEEARAGQIAAETGTTERLCAAFPRVQPAEHERIMASWTTCRQFGKPSVEIWKAMHDVLQSVGDAYAWKCGSTKLMFWMVRTDGELPYPVDRFDGDHVQEISGSAVSRQDVRDLTIGQASAGRGSVTVWVGAFVRDLSPETYETALVGLGQLGQSVIMECSRRGWGVFMTPAVKDARLASSFGVPAQNWAFYSLTIGRSKGESGRRS